ncbi:MAG: hypothetical protein MR654_08115 [Corynebacterium glucuronolyticum]|nr:hypothetical protein [Corynebacterium glucuronolyticum]
MAWQLNRSRAPTQLTESKLVDEPVKVGHALEKEAVSGVTGCPQIPLALAD